MTLTQLEYIVALDTHRHFVTASEKCFVTQPTLSMQVQKLEKELDVLLFDRKKQPLEPTPVGKELIRRARQVLREVQEMRDFVKNEKEILAGEIKIGIIPTLAPYLIPLFLSGFLKKHPPIRPVIEELQTEDLVHRLVDGRLDIGLLVTPLEEKGLEEIPVFEETFVAYLSEGHPLLAKRELSLSDLEAHDLWILNEGHCFRNQILQICQQKPNHERAFVYESGSLDTLRKMVEQRFGYTLLPQLALHDIHPDRWEFLRYFEEPQPARQISLVVHERFLKRRLVESLREEIFAQLPETIRKRSLRQQLVPLRMKGKA
ncbi:MAG: LysR substrate-binding domain-containing protein [Microscillaceae bacterium]